MADQPKKINPKTKTKFSGTYPNAYLQLCAKGGSKIEFCASIGVTEKTFDNWCKTYPEMQEAKELGRVYAEAWWLKEGRLHLVTHSSKEEGTTIFNTNLYKFIVAGRFKHTGERRLRIPKLHPTDVESNLKTIYKMAGSGQFTQSEIASTLNLVMNSITVDQQVLIRKDIEEIKHGIQTKQETYGRTEEIEDGA